MRRKARLTRIELAYSCHFQPEPEGGYTVTCPSLPAVVTFGETLDEARANAREAIELCLDVLRDEGRPIPLPDRDLRRAFDELVAISSSAERGASRRFRVTGLWRLWSVPVSR